MGEQVHIHGSPGLTDAYVSGIESWMVLTIVSGLPMLWAMSLILQMGRPYVMRVLGRLGLRFGADIWWLSYVLVRDFVMIATFAVSFIFLVPDLARSEPQPLFGGLSVLFLFWGLAVRLMGDADDNPRHFTMLTVLITIGAALFFVPMVFGVKAMSADENAAHTRFLVTSTNWEWAKWIIVASWAGIVVTAAVIFNFFMARSLRPVRAPARQPSVESPATAPVAAEGQR